MSEYHCSCCKILIPKIERLKKKVEKLRAKAGYQSGMIKKQRAEEALFGKNLLD